VVGQEAAPFLEGPVAGDGQAAAFVRGADEAEARFHDLRHFYASALIGAGESVKTVQAALGHASAVETLETCAGLWPDSQARTRAAVDDLGLRSQVTTCLDRSREASQGLVRGPTVAAVVALRR
jgi:hypothetical protein